MVDLKRALIIREFDKSSANMRWHDPDDVREIIASSVLATGVIIDSGNIPYECCKKIAKTSDNILRNNYAIKAVVRAGVSVMD